VAASHRLSEGNASLICNCSAIQPYLKIHQIRTLQFRNQRTTAKISEQSACKEQCSLLKLITSTQGLAECNGGVVADRGVVEIQRQILEISAIQSLDESLPADIRYFGTVKRDVGMCDLGEIVQGAAQRDARGISHQCTRQFQMQLQHVRTLAQRLTQGGASFVGDTSIADPQVQVLQLRSVQARNECLAPCFGELCVVQRQVSLLKLVTCTQGIAERGGGAVADGGILEHQCQVL